MDVFYSYTYGTCAWFTLQSLPLLISPTIIITLLSPEVREATPLEEYFSRVLGISLFTLGLMVILLTGSVPLTSSLSDSTSFPALPLPLADQISCVGGVTTELEDPKAPYAVPVLTISFFYHAANTIICYARYTTSQQVSFILGATGSGLLASVGLWCILFASSSGRISRKTGADKRTSGFPFSNKESASAKKKNLGKAI